MTGTDDKTEVAARLAHGYVCHDAPAQGEHDDEEVKAGGEDEERHGILSMVTG